MERQELLNQFNALIEAYSKHKAYGDKARAQAASFSSGVIEKVIADHQIKASLVADDIIPLVPLISDQVAEVEAARGEVEQSKGDFGSRIEELELRKLIGEISDDEFEEMTSEGRDTVAAADSEIGVLDEALSELQGALDKWVSLSGASVEVAVPVSAEAEDDGFDEPDSVVDAILPGLDADPVDEQAVSEESVEFERDDADDESDGFAEEAVGFDIDDGEIEASVDVIPVDEQEEPVEVEVEDSGVDEIGADPSEEVSGAVDADAEGPRRAILLSNEGTPDEQIYALTGDVFTIGRGRDNDLQIKNDSKVSRFHSKLYRRGSNYYLEDNKSSNGTMVNGELISERRLFGGEELVIGETFFRFRVM
jgi:hypothetical protein